MTCISPTAPTWLSAHGLRVVFSVTSTAATSEAATFSSCAWRITARATRRTRAVSLLNRAR